MSDADDLTGSILTPSQREFLRFDPGEEMSPAAKRMTRSRIRTRLGAGIVDLSIILDSDYLDLDDIEMAFTEPVDVDYPPKPTDIIKEAIAILFLGSLVDDDQFSSEDSDGTTSPHKFEQHLEAGIERALNRRGHSVYDCSAEIEIEIEGALSSEDSTELYRLPADRIARLHLANEISEEEYLTAVVKRHNEPPVGEDRIDE